MAPSRKEKNEKEKNLLAFEKLLVLHERQDINFQKTIMKTD